MALSRAAGNTNLAAFHRRAKTRAKLANAAQNRRVALSALDLRIPLAKQSMPSYAAKKQRREKIDPQRSARFGHQNRVPRRASCGATRICRSPANVGRSLHPARQIRRRPENGRAIVPARTRAIRWSFTTSPAATRSTASSTRPPPRSRRPCPLAIAISNGSPGTPTSAAPQTSALPHHRRQNPQDESQE